MCVHFHKSLFFSYGELFLAYGNQILLSTLQAGDIVVLNNLSSHKVAGVEKAMTLFCENLLVDCHQSRLGRTGTGTAAEVGV